MSAYVTPAKTLDTFKDRLDSLSTITAIEVFPASKVVGGIFFTTEELLEYPCPEGETMVISVQDGVAFAKEIPEYENGKRNYYPVMGTQALAKLDKFP